MKVYKCDSCGRTIDNPYKVKMKEFYISYEYDYGIAFPYNYRKKQKYIFVKIVTEDFIP